MSEQIRSMNAIYKKGTAPEEVQRPIIRACFVCMHGCEDKKGRSRCETYTKLLQLDNKLKRIKRTKNESSKEIIQALRTLEKKCLICSRSVYDVASHSGQYFSSLDAGVSSGENKLDNTSLQDWLLSKRAQTSRTERLTTLPYDVEEKLRVQLLSFMQLDLVDKFLVCVLTTLKPKRASTYYNLVDFAKDFAPFIYGHKITKQAVHARLKHILKEMPLLSSVVRRSIRK